jgi:hypothetical protein
MVRPSGAPGGGVGVLPAALACALAVAFVLSVLRAAGWRGEPPAPAPDAIFASPLVSKAPATALAPHGTSNITDSRGAYVRVGFGAVAAAAAAGTAETPLALDCYVNVMYSKKGAYRSGDLHKCDQINALVSGSAILTTLEKGAERKKYMQPGEAVTTPAGVPHLFHFRADSIMTEYWVHAGNGSLCEFQAWYYKPFRDRIHITTR